MVQDIDDKTGTMLAEVFPNLDILFLHRHAAWLMNSYPPQWKPSSEVDGPRRVVEVSEFVSNSRIFSDTHADVLCLPRILQSEEDTIAEPAGGVKANLSL
jgi:hypothetical protein